MSMKWIASAFVCTGLAFACGGGDGGGGSGVPGDTLIADVTPDEAADFCEYLIGLQEQPERTIDCGDGEPFTVGINPADVNEAIADCTEGIQTVTEACTATIGDAETCFETIESLTDAQLCDPNFPIPAACQTVLLDENC